MARTGKYQKWLEKDNLILLEGWARDGLVDEQIAHNIGINIATLYDWKNKYSEIDNALKKGKEVVDLEVENALLKRALGYTIEEKHVRKVTKNGITTEYVEKTTREIPADTTAQIFWLKNRRPDKWRDKPREDETSEAMKAMLESIAEMTKITNAPVENRNIEDME